MERLNFKKEEITESLIRKELSRLWKSSTDLVDLSKNNLTDDGYVLMGKCLSDLFIVFDQLNESNPILTYEKANLIIDRINEIIRNYSTQKIILKSTHPEEYPDLEIVCRVIQNDKIGEYLKSISDDKKFYAYKDKLVKARRGKVGEVVKTTLKTIVDGKEYILSEEENTVKERTYTKRTKISNDDIVEQEVTAPDMIITNYHSTSNEEYVVKHEKFMDTYEFIEDDRRPRHSYGFSPRFMPKYDSRLLIRVDENIIIVTAWGSFAVCLSGSYIVTYNEQENDYNTLEKGAFESTYTKENQTKKKSRK